MKLEVRRWYLIYFSVFNIISAYIRIRLVLETGQDGTSNWFTQNTFYVHVYNVIVKVT